MIKKKNVNVAHIVLLVQNDPKVSRVLFYGYLSSHETNIILARLSSICYRMLYINQRSAKFFITQISYGQNKRHLFISLFQGHTRFFNRERENLRR